MEKLKVEKEKIKIVIINDKNKPKHAPNLDLKPIERGAWMEYSKE